MSERTRGLGAITVRCHEQCWHRLPAVVLAYWGSMTDDPDDIEKRWQDVLNIPAKQPSVKVLRLLRQREKRSAAEKKAPRAM